MSREADLFEKQYLHIMNSAQNYISRDRVELYAFMSPFLPMNPGLEKEELFNFVWSKSPAFRESWWEHVNTNAMWLDRSLAYTEAYGESLGLPPPSTFNEAKSQDNQIHNLLYPGHNRKEAPDETWKLIPRENVSKISELEDEFAKTIMGMSTQVINDSRAKREGSRSWQVWLASIGAVLLVFGKLLGWRIDCQTTKR